MQPVKHQKAPPRPSVGLAIRDDGMLYPATANVLRMANFRPYHGDPAASLDERMAFLRGAQQRSTVAVQIENGQFDLSAASKGDLAEFALIEYGITLDLRKSIDELRLEVAAQADVVPPPEQPGIPTLADADPEQFKRTKPRKDAAGIGVG